MDFDINALVPRIREILTAPGTDLGTISAKRVRKRLLEKEPRLTSEKMKEFREEIDALIGEVYETVSGPVGQQDGDVVKEEESVVQINGKRKKEDEDDTEEQGGGDEEELDEPETPPKKKVRKSVKAEPSDAEIARQLSNELNSRSRSSRAGKAKANGPKKAGRKSKKSAATVDSDEDEGSSKKKKRSGGARGGFAKEYTLSDPLAAVLDADKLSRPQVVKQLWIYIKGNDLQNPSNKKEILCDTKLRAVFNTDKVDMFRMNKIIGQHLHEP